MHLRCFFFSKNRRNLCTFLAENSGRVNFLTNLKSANIASFWTLFKIIHAQKCNLNVQHKGVSKTAILILISLTGLIEWIVNFRDTHDNCWQMQKLIHDINESYMTDRECHWTTSGILEMFSTNLELKSLWMEMFGQKKPMEGRQKSVTARITARLDFTWPERVK